MKVSCEIIKDLLPLYHDGVCSEESHAEIDGHIAECEECKAILEAFSDTAVSSGFPRLELPDGSKLLKAISEAWRKGKIKSFIKGALIAALTLGILAGAAYIFIEVKITPVPEDLIEISDVSRLSDGRIIYHLKINDNKQRHTIHLKTTEDGTCYAIPKRVIDIDIEESDEDEKNFRAGWHILDITENNTYSKRFENGAKLTSFGAEITSFYVGSVGKGVLVWEEGMELPPASEELERHYSRTNGSDSESRHEQMLRESEALEKIKEFIDSETYDKIVREILAELERQNGDDD